MNTLDYALRYVECGWHVLPLAPNSKIPATPRGLHDSSSDPRIVANWFSTGQNGLAIRTGQVSGIVVLDVDSKNDGLNTLNILLSEKKIPETYNVITPSGGYHYYFKAPESALRNRIGLLQGIDFKAENGYVVAPPTTIDSKPYCPPVKKDMFDFSNTSIDDIASLPEWLLELVEQKSNEIDREIYSEGEVLEGGRTSYLVSLAGTMRRRGIGETGILSALIVENDEKCSPPLEDWEVNNIAKSVSKYAPAIEVGDAHIPTKESFVLKASSLVDKTVDYLKNKDLVKGEPTELCCGTLDKLLGGGKRLGEVTAWHAEAKTGKNTLWHKMMHSWLNKGIPIGYASRELSPEIDVIPNLLSLELQKNCWLAEPDANKYSELLKKWPLYFAKGYGFFPFPQLETWINELTELGVKYFWFDHLHYMLENPEDFMAASRLIKDIKTLAKKNDIHVDIIIQPNKLHDGQELSLNSIKGGAAMGQAIDNLVTFQRIKNVSEKNISELSVKAIRSKLGKLGKLYLKYDPRTTDFIELEKTDDVIVSDPFTGNR